MTYNGDFDDAVNVIDVWMHEHPTAPVWERDTEVSELDSGSFTEPKRVYGRYY